MGLSWFRLLSRFVTGVIQWPQSGIQRHQTTVESDIVAEASDLDAEYEALVASSAVLV